MKYCVIGASMMDSPVQLPAGITGRRPSFIQTDDCVSLNGGERRMSKCRRPSFCKTDTFSDCKSHVSLLTGLPPGGKLLSVEHTWNPVEASIKDTERKISANVIDKRSLYSIKREHIASRELPFLSGNPRICDNPATTNVEHLIEKNYIINSKLPNAIPEKFPNVIMTKFHRLSNIDDKNSYGMPRPPTAKKKPFEVVMDGLKREPSIVQIRSYPTLQEPVRCSESDEFCEILGPSACQICIENTNRFIGEQLQHMSFPTINISTEKLIYPKLSKLMKDGHGLQVRKKRIRDLGLELPHSLMFLKRKETRLSSSTCLSCKKPFALASISRKSIKAKKLNIKQF